VSGSGYFGLCEVADSCVMDRDCALYEMSCLPAELEMQDDAERA
jgi:hypothetical protein